MALEDADWYKVYEDQLKLPSHGLPLWNPQPSSSANRVNIGDAGFTYKGQFYRIFSALTKNDKYRGNAEPLVIDPSTDIKRVERPAVPIFSDTVQVVDTMADSRCVISATGNIELTFAPRFVIYSFESTSPSGAVLIPLTSLQEESLSPSKEGEWKRYVARNLNDLPDPEVCSKRDILLVYKYILVHEWVMVVFEMALREDGK